MSVYAQFFAVREQLNAEARPAPRTIKYGDDEYYTAASSCLGMSSKAARPNYEARIGSTEEAERQSNPPMR
jgi:hypothetical protein